MININTSISYFTKKYFMLVLFKMFAGKIKSFFCKQKNPIIVEPWSSFLFIQIRNILEIWVLYHIIFFHSASCIFAFVN